MNLFGKRILAVVAHHDDLEFMFGGTLAKLFGQQKVSELYVCVLCSREKNTGELFEDVLLQQKKSFSILGIKPKKILNHRFRSRFLPSHEDEVRLILNSYKKDFCPDTVLTHYPEDPNQDHSSLFEQVYRVFRNTNILSGEIPNTGDDLKPNLFIKLDTSLIEKKYLALNAYNAENNKRYFTKEAIYSLAYVRGLHSMKSNLCEALRIIRMHGQ